MSKQSERDVLYCEYLDGYVKCVNALGELMQLGYAPRAEVLRARGEIVDLKAEVRRLTEALLDAEQRGRETIASPYHCDATCPNYGPDARAQAIRDCIAALEADPDRTISQEHDINKLRELLADDYRHAAFPTVEE